MLLEGLRNRQQRRSNDCLVACCKQILDSFGIEKSEDWLWKQLVSSLGYFTSFSNVRNLADSLGLVVVLQTDGVVEDFAPYIESGLPVIVAVDADDPTQWPYYSNHAVVVIGFDDAYIYVNDPAQPATGLRVGRGAFELAWSERDYESIMRNSISTRPKGTRFGY